LQCQRCIAFGMHGNNTVEWMPHGEHGNSLIWCSAARFWG
jgi:hypothetical protein